MRSSLQVVECRRILKWTYAYGYYSFQPAEERRKGSPPAATKEQQGFFEFNQVQREPLTQTSCIGSCPEGLCQPRVSLWRLGFSCGWHTKKGVWVQSQIVPVDQVLSTGGWTTL